MTYFISLFQIIVYLIVSLPIKFFFQPKVQIKNESKKLNKGIIIAANHQSRLDLFLIFSSIPFGQFIKLIPIRGVVAEKYSNTWWKKLFLQSLGTLPLKTGQKESAKSLLLINDLLEKGFTILLFPEGKVVNEGEIVQAKPGIGYLSSKKNIKVVPVYLAGFRDVNIFNMILRKYKAKVLIGIPRSFYKKEPFNAKNISTDILKNIYKLEASL